MLDNELFWGSAVDEMSKESIAMHATLGALLGGGAGYGTSSSKASTGNKLKRTAIGALAGMAGGGLVGALRPKGKSIYQVADEIGAKALRDANEIAMKKKIIWLKHMVNKRVV
jgi:hypothetical protein